MKNRLLIILMAVALLVSSCAERNAGRDQAEGLMKMKVNPGTSNSF